MSVTSPSLLQRKSDYLIGLEHATIRDNIIFGSTSGFEEERYRAVLEACALTKDLEMFDAGDLTGKDRDLALFWLASDYGWFGRDWRERNHTFWWPKGSSCPCSSDLFTSQGWCTPCYYNRKP